MPEPPEMTETERAMTTEEAIKRGESIVQVLAVGITFGTDVGEHQKNVRALRHLISEARKVPGLIQSLKRETDGRSEARRQLNLVKTDAEGVWRWQGDGDDPESLSCPVVMSADTLRGFVSEARRAERVREWSTAEKRIGEDLIDGYELAQEHAQAILNAPDTGGK